MSVLGSQVDVDIDESVPDPVPKHQGHTGTGCYKLHDHEFLRPKHRTPRKGSTGRQTHNIMDLPVDDNNQGQLNVISASAVHQSLVSKHCLS